MNKTIWIVNQFASHLEERHLNLAANFAEKGYNVVVITTSFHHRRHVYGMNMYKLNNYPFSGKLTVFTYNADNVVKDTEGLVVLFGDPQVMADANERVMTYTSAELKEIAA